VTGDYLLAGKTKFLLLASSPPSLEDERSNSIQRSESYLQQARSAQEVEVVIWKEDPDKIT